MFSASSVSFVICSVCFIILLAPFDQFVKSDDTEFMARLDKQYHQATSNSRVSADNAPEPWDNGQQYNEITLSAPLENHQNLPNEEDTIVPMDQTKLNSKASESADSRTYGNQQSYKDLVTHDPLSKDIGANVLSNTMTFEYQNTPKVEDALKQQPGLLVQDDPQCLCEGNGFVTWKDYDYYLQRFSYHYCKDGSKYEASIQPYTMGCLFIQYPTNSIGLLANHDRCIGENMKFHQRLHGVSIGWDESKSRNVLFELCGKSNGPTCCTGFGSNRRLLKGYCMVYILDSDYFKTKLSYTLIKLSLKMSRQILSSNISADELLKIFLDILNGKANPTKKRRKKYKQYYGDYVSNSSNFDTDSVLQSSYRDSRSNMLSSIKDDQSKTYVATVPSRYRRKIRSIDKNRENMTLYKGVSDYSILNGKRQVGKVIDERMAVPLNMRPYSGTVAVKSLATTAPTPAVKTVKTSTKTPTTTTTTTTTPLTTPPTTSFKGTKDTPIKAAEQTKNKEHKLENDSYDNGIEKRTTLCIFNDDLCTVLDWF